MWAEIEVWVTGEADKGVMVQLSNDTMWRIIHAKPDGNNSTNGVSGRFLLLLLGRYTSTAFSDGFERVGYWIKL